jgi:hypothetical protein
MHPKLVFPLALTLASLAAAQTTYYVDPVNGSDTRPGTSRSTAIRSLTYASSLLADDDRLILLPGTYSPTLTGEQIPIRLGNTISQQRIHILAEGGPEVTIFDGENQAIDSLTPMIRFYQGAEGARLEGLQFVNTGSADYWSMAIRLGSTTGGTFRVKDLEISRCIFRNVHRAIVLFGSNNTLTNPGGASTGCRIHDNLVENTTHRAFAIWGEGINHITNNTVVNAGYEGIYVDSLGAGSGQGGSNAVVTNNIVVGSLNNGGIALGATASNPNASFDSNLAFGNANGNDFVGASFPPSNIVADPLFVGAGDARLLPGSPAIQTGSSAVLAQMRVDLDGFPRIHDSDGDGIAAADRGAYQYTRHGMTVTGNWVPGGTVTYGFTAPSGGGAVVIFGYAAGAVPLPPFGMLAIDPLAIMTAASLGGAPGTTPLLIPNDPGLLGGRLLSQGVYVGGGTGAVLLNVVDVTL